MENSRNGNVSGRVLVEPSMNNTSAPTGAPEVENFPLASVRAERLVPLILAVALGIGWFALSRTIPLTAVFAGFLGVTPEAMKVAGVSVNPSMEAKRSEERRVGKECR